MNLARRTNIDNIEALAVQHGLRTGMDCAYAELSRPRLRRVARRIGNRHEIDSPRLFLPGRQVVGADPPCPDNAQPTSLAHRSEEHTSELQSLMRSSYAVFCLKKKRINREKNKTIEDDT